MNHIFKKTVGGVLSLPELPVCTDTDCQYEIDISYKKVKVINIETFFISDIEELDITHYEGYYDKTYKYKTELYYKLPYSDSIENLDISITLIPVNGSASLYVNPITKPLTLDSYYWKETGGLAKKVTIKWDEL